MAKKKMLIVDDDSTVSKALSECFMRKGFEVITESKADKALSIMRVQEINGAVIDCMIPGMNGVDLAKKLRDDLNFQDKIVLISGIFKDQNFAKNSIKKSAATDFLFKPLDLEKLLSIFLSNTSEEDESDDNWLRSLSKGNDGISELLKIKELNILNVPLLFSGIKNNNLTLEIKIQNKVDNFDFRFSKGELIFCTSDSKNVFVKKEVLKKGIIKNDQYNKFVDGKGDLISELIDKSMMSPHLRSDLENLASVNLFTNLLLNSEGVVSCEINEVDTVNFENSIQIPNKHLLNFDILKNKVDPLFLQTYLSNINSFMIQVNDSFKNNKELQTIPLAFENSEFISSMSLPVSAAKVLNENKNIDFQKLIYFLHINDCLDLSEPELGKEEIPKLEKRFESMLRGIDGKLPEEIFMFLGVDDTRAIFVSTFFKSFAKLNHPDRLPRSAPESLHKLNQKVFSIISEAHGVLVDPEKKKAYLEELNNQKAENMLKSEALKERGQDLIKKSDYASALEYFEKSKELCPDSTNTLYYYWCYMKVNKKIEDKKVRLDIYNELVSFPIEDKRNELYSLVLGIFYKRSKKFEEAIAEYNKALGYNENFLPARRELLNLVSKMKEAKGKTDTNIFSADLGTVVSNIFKKKAN